RAPLERHQHGDRRRTGEAQCGGHRAGERAGAAAVLMSVPKAARARAAALRKEIEHNSRLYYVEDNPEITDAEYDKPFRGLEAREAQHPELRAPDSPTQRVGGAPLEQFAEVRHRTPMLSINNAFDEEDVRAFDRRAREGLGVEPVEYAAEPKFDGLAISLTY